MVPPRTETVSFPLIFQLGTTIGSIIHTLPEMIYREGRGTTELKQIFSNQPISGQVNPPKAGEWLVNLSKKRVKNTGKANRRRNPRNWLTSLLISKAYNGHQTVLYSFYLHR
jgi:hypothetical protein